MSSLPLKVTAFSIVSAMGNGLQPMWSATRTDSSALAPIRFTDRLPIDAWTGEVEGLESPLSGKWAVFDCRNHRLVELALQDEALREALETAKATYGSDRIGVFTATSTSGILSTETAYHYRDPQTGALPRTFSYAATHNTDAIGSFVRARLGLDGPGYTISTACAATAKAFAAAARMIEQDLCDAALVGGADSLCLTTLFGFHSLGVMTEGACRPFDKSRSGISIGEAGGFALLERVSAPSASEDFCLLGYGETSDAYHMSSPDPEGGGSEAAMRLALKQAHLGAEDIDFVHMHGTATLAGDAAEDRAVSRVFKDATPRGSTKGATGHTLGATGMIGLATARLAIENGFLPGNIGLEEPTPGFSSAYVKSGHAARVRKVMCNAFGFGGVNCTLIFGFLNRP